MTHKLKNSYTKEGLTLLQKFQGPQEISQPGDLAKGLRTSREFDFEGQWDLITELPQDWGNRPLCIRTQKKGTVTPQETKPDLPVSVQESPV